ncbi:two-component sensor histidine kinase [Nitratireductor sp. B36]|uniref:sensor histidine kinase n=1 Tax=Nitratireductor sp. B36 TaxID=2762059 RepID=UPI001E551D1F|nr:ATP-binding protein [Nitratireductor sp. B36]MCC5780436.1 two-component sensor histidine kinase [Nitratireductor sp. B36]
MFLKIARMKQNAPEQSPQASRSLRIAGAWLVLAVLTVAAVVANERWRLSSRLAAEGRALHSLASQRADQHDAHLTALSAVAVSAGENRFDLFLEVAETIHRFYPRIVAIELVPLKVGETGVNTLDRGNPAVTDAIREAALTSQGELALRPTPGAAGRYLLVKRSPNTDAARYGLALDIDGRGLLEPERSHGLEPSVNLSLALPDGTQLVGQETAGDTAFRQRLGSASQPLVLEIAVPQTLASLFPPAKLAPALILMSAVFLAGLVLWQQWARRRQAEQAAQLSAQETRLAHASRVNALGEMASGIAHELTQPLTAMLSQAQAGKRLLRNGDTGAVASVLDELIGQARRGADILAHLREWIRPVRSNPVAVTDLNAAILGVEALLMPEARKRAMTLRLILERDALPVRADQTELEQVIFNLVRNAFEALESMPKGRGEVMIESSRQAGLAVLDVRDNGPGVDAEIRAQIFEPFVTGKSHGTGLGLALSQRLAERMDGEIELKPSQEGAWFQVRLNLVDMKAEVAA